MYREAFDFLTSLSQEVANLRGVIEMKLYLQHYFMYRLQVRLKTFFKDWTITKDVNRDSHIASSPISQSSSFKGVRCLILAISQRKLREYIEFL